MPRTPWMKWNPADFLADPRVDDLTPSQELLYRRLLEKCHLGGGLLTRREKLLRRMGHADAESTFDADWEVVSRFFEDHPEDARYLTNKRVYGDLVERDAKARAGKIGGKAKHLLKADATNNTEADATSTRARDRASGYDSSSDSSSSEGSVRGDPKVGTIAGDAAVLRARWNERFRAKQVTEPTARKLIKVIRKGWAGRDAPRAVMGLTTNDEALVAAVAAIDRYHAYLSQRGELPYMRPITKFFGEGTWLVEPTELYAQPRAKNTSTRSGKHLSGNWDDVPGATP